MPKIDILTLGLAGYSVSDHQDYWDVRGPNNLRETSDTQLEGWEKCWEHYAHQDDPMQSDNPATELKVQPREHVIVVWDRNGKFFQVWTSKYKDGAGIEHGITIAKKIGGTYHDLP